MPNDMGIPLNTVPFYDNGGGLNLKYSATKVPEDEASLCLNIDYSTDGAFFTRNGSRIQNQLMGIPQQISGAPKCLNLSQYRNSTGLEVEVETFGTEIFTDFTSPVSVVSGLSASQPYPDTEFMVTNDNEYLIWGNGDDENLKFDGTTWTNLSLPRPSAVTFGVDGAGVLPADTYDYYVSFVRTVAGVIVQESQLSLVASHTIAAPASINLIVPVCTETLLTGVTAQCNGRQIYRKNNTTGDIVRLTATVTIPDNVTTTYNDNIVDADLDNFFFADFTYQAAPKSKVFEYYNFNANRIFYVDAENPTDIYYSQPNRPWNVIIDPNILDAEVRCLKRIFGALIAGTDRSVSVLNGDILQTSFIRVSSSVGILNNRCAVGDDSGVLYFLATNYKMYVLSPTQFSQSEIRFTDPISLKVDPLFANINTQNSEIPCMELYTIASVAKVVLSAPVGVATNNNLIIYNQSQAQIKQKPVWQLWNNINASALKQFTVGTNINLYSGDYNGFIWKLDDKTINGDGAEENGTVTASGVDTLTDDTQTWDVNAFVGMRVRIIDGVGIDQVRTIVSNTADTLTVDSNWITSLNTSSAYTIGGYDVYNFSNWKAVLSREGGDNQNEAYDLLKQLWFIWVNANASGDYTISLILQFDFDQTTSHQTTLLLSLAAGNAIWGSVTWLDFIWGSFEVFEDRLRQYSKFRAIRVAFMHRQAGQPFQINGYSLSVQNKNLFFKQTA